MATKKPAEKAPAKKAPAKKAAADKPATKRAPNPAFMKPMTIGVALQPVVGTDPIPRSEVIKRMWVYIKKHNLQDPIDKRNINGDAVLQKVFGGKKTVTMFEMAKHVNNHLS